MSSAFDSGAPKTSASSPASSADRQGTEGDSRRPAFGPALGYWIIAAAVTIYVALTTGYRDELIAADAWEHHRAIRVLAEVGLAAGNPTQASPEPSIRYSPYTVVLAVISHARHFDSYNVLSMAAVVNTALVFASLFVFLRSYDRQACGVWVLAPMLFLYGEAPGYANSLALEDLPWQQVNPSAFSLALCLLAWATWRWTEARLPRLFLAIPICGGLIACAMLSHGMTGLLGGVGLVAVSLADRGPTTLRLLAAAFVTLVLALGLCALWPWYSYVAAVGSRHDLWYWYNPFIVRRMLFVWCLPCVAAAMLALPYRREAIVRTCFLGLGACLALGGAAVALHSPTFARLPLAGLLFAQILTGYTLWRWRLLDRGSLRSTLTALRSFDPASFAHGALRVLLPAAILYAAVLEISDVLHEPHLLRPRIAALLHKDSKRSHRLEAYRHVLRSVDEEDVVLADLLTSWPVPSVRGRIVGAQHLEFFVPDQRERWESSQEFFEPQTGFARRQEILDRYHVRWLLLDRIRNAPVLSELLALPCVAAEQDSLLLLDARCWASQQSLNPFGRQRDP